MGLREFLGTYGIAWRPPAIAASYHGGVVVCGDAACIWEDLEMFGCDADNKVEKSGWDFLTVNKAVETFPGVVEHCYCNLPDTLLRFVAARRDEYVSEFGSPRHTHAAIKGADWEWPWSRHGTSGLGATLTALALGYDRIVLCGLPLDNSPHNGEPHWRRSSIAQEADLDGNHWQRAMSVAFDGKVKSMSGRTWEWLGPP